MMNGLMMKDFRLLILRKQTLLLFLGISILIALTSDTSAFIFGISSYNVCADGSEHYIL